MQICNNCGDIMVKSEQPEAGTLKFKYVCPTCGQDMEVSD